MRERSRRAPCPSPRDAGVSRTRLAAARARSLSFHNRRRNGRARRQREEIEALRALVADRDDVQARPRLPALRARLGSGIACRARRGAKGVCARGRGW